MSPSWRPQTQLIHGGTNRSPHGETSEALFLTSGFCYERAEDAEARFAETQEGYTTARRQPHCPHARGAHGVARGPRGLCGHGQRHGGGTCGADVPAQDGHAGRRVGPAVRLLPLDPPSFARASASRSSWSTARILPPGAGPWAGRPISSSWNRPATRRSSWSTWRPSARSRIARAPRWSSTMYSPRRCCNGRSSWVPILSSTLVPSTSTARGAASVA